MNNHITNNHKTLFITNQIFKCKQDMHQETCISHHFLIVILQFREEDLFHQEIVTK